MRKARFTEHQIIAVIKSVVVGRTVKDVFSRVSQRGTLSLSVSDIPYSNTRLLSVQNAERITGNHREMVLRI